MRKIWAAFLGLILYTFVISWIILWEIHLDNGLASPADGMVDLSDSENGTRPKLILF